MLNYTLYINGSEVELDEKTNIALTRTYESLEDPSKIFTEYSKTVKIPMTARNNRVFENAFRADQVVTTDGIDPRKKVPFILFNNQSIIMVGVAKVIDTASNSPKDKNYYVVLYSKTGEIFNELKQLTFHPTDDNRYTIADPLSYGCAINRNIVRDSFRQESHIIDIDDKGDLDYIGFMPTYQGKYPDFQSDKAEVMPGVFTYPLRPEDANGNQLDEGVEVDEHYMHQFRSYYQQPFVYVDAIWQLLKRKIEQMGDYRLELDPSWFNPQNPYYTDLIVTMPSLYDDADSDAGEEPTEHLAEHVNNYVSNTRTNSDLSNNHKQALSFSHASGTHLYRAGNRFDGGRTMHFKSDFDFTLFAANPDPQLTDGYARLRDDNNLFLEIRAVDAYTNQYIPGAVSKFQFYSNSTSHASEAYTSIDLGITSRNNPPYTTNPDPDVISAWNGYAWCGTFTAEFDVTWPNPFYIIANQYAANNGDPFESALGSWVPRWDWLWQDFYTINQTVNGHYWYLTSKNTECTLTTARRSNSKLTMNRIWSIEKTPFEVMLDYAKMFRLVFDLDSDEKVLRVMSRERYFEDSTVVDWTDKLDRSKEYKLKPINFDKKYLDFKLAEGSGGLYQRYLDLYGRNYGSYKVETGYDFNSDATELFTEIPPSLIASKSQDSISFNTLHPNDPNFLGYGYKYLPNEYFPDNDDDGKNAGNSGQFFFRNGTYAPDQTLGWSRQNTGTAIISDDTDWQLTHGEYCWTLVGSYIAECDRLPAISTYSRDGRYSVHFAKPKELYFKRSIVDYANSGYVYDTFWRDYLDDRYSVQTKVLNTYMYLTPQDWMDFKFNKFVLIDHVLYMVNQIKDFDLSTDRSTKVELVQVNDRANYSNTGARFPYLYTLPGTASVASGGTASVHVYSSSAWSVSSHSAWLYAVKNGDSLDIYGYSVNNSLTSNGTVVLSNADGLQWVVTVANAQNGVLVPSTNYMWFQYGGGTRTVTVSASGSTPIVASKPDWITTEFNYTSWSYRDIVRGTGLVDARDADMSALRDSRTQLTVTAARNNTRNARSGYIIVSNSIGGCVIRVAQGGNPNIIPITPDGGTDIWAIDDVQPDRLDLAAGEASRVELNTPSQVDFLTLGISYGQTDSTGSANIGETSFRVQPEVSQYHTDPGNADVDGGYVTVTTVDGQHIRWPYNIGAVPTYDVHIYAYDGNGYVTVDGVDGNYLSDHQSGDTIAISATANAGFSFAGWSDGSTTASRTVTVGTGPLTLYATFAKTVVSRSVAYSLTNVKSSNSAATVADGTMYTTTLTPIAGYQIATVKVVMNGSDITASSYSGGKVVIGSVTANVTITANATVVENDWDYKWSADDGVPPLNFKLFDTSTGDISNCVQDTGGSFTEFNGKKVWLHDADSTDEWYLPGPTNIEYLEMEAVLGFKDPDGSYPLLEMSGYSATQGVEIRLRSNYRMEYNKGGVMVASSLTLNPDKVGLQDLRTMVSVDGDKESIKVGNMFGYEGTLENNLSLANDNGIFNGNSGSKFMLSELRLRWKLKAATTPTYTVTVSGLTGGDVVVDGVQGSYADTVNGGTVMAISAVPDQGETFAKWSDNDTSANRSIKVNSDITLNAVFVPESNYVIYYETDDGQIKSPGTDPQVMHGPNDFCTLVSNTYQDGQGMLVYDKSVVAILGDFYDGDWFTGNNITAVTLPDTVVAVGGSSTKQPFRGTHITSIDLKRTEKLYNSFKGCPITSLYIPKTLTYFGQDGSNGILAQGFEELPKLEKIKVDPANPVYDSRNDCNCIIHTKTNTVINGSLNSVIDDTVQSINRNAFNSLPITKMKFGRRVAEIMDKAFVNCTRLAELTFTTKKPPRCSGYESPFYNVAASGVIYCPAGSGPNYEDFKDKWLPNGWTVQEL